jgi:cell division protein FtsZ
MTLLALNDAPHASMAGLPRRVLLREDALRAVAELDDRVVPDLHTDAERELASHLAGHDVVFVAAGLGGQTGGHGANAAVRVAGREGALSVALVTLPFGYEGSHRRQVARESLERLRRRAHGVVVFASDGLLRLAPHLPIVKAFAVMRRFVVQPVEELLRVLTRADVPLLREIWGPCGEIRLGTGKGEGRHRAFVAVEEAFQSPWFDVRVERARAAVALVAHGPGAERFADEVGQELHNRVPLAAVVVGAYRDESLDEGLRATVLLGL